MIRKKILPQIIFWILYLSYTATYILRLNLSCSSTVLEQIGKLSTTQLAFLGGVFSAAYAIGKLLNGGLGDRLKPWIMVSTGLFLAGISNIGMAFLPPMWAMALCWGLNAFGQSMLWGAILRMVSALFDKETAQKRAPVMGTSIALGNVLGILIASKLVTSVGIHGVFWVPGVMAAILAIAVALTARKTITQESKGTFPLKQLLRRDVLAVILPAVIHGAIKDNVSLFMVDYFSKQFQLDTTQNPLYILFIPLSGFLGRTAYPLLYKLMGSNEHKVSILGFLLCAACALPLGLNPRSATFATVCLCGIYAFMSIVNTSFLTIYPLRFSKEGNVSSICSIMDFITYLGHAASTAIYGTVIVKLGYGFMYRTWSMLSVVAMVLMALCPYILKKQKKQSYLCEDNHYEAN